LTRLAQWARCQGGGRLRVCFDRRLPDIRQSLDGVAAVIVDATEDSALAVDALLQAVNQCGTEPVAVYTQRGDEELELFVRAQGALFLLGPMSQVEWNGFLEPRVDKARRLAAAGPRGSAGQMPPPREGGKAA
jgi:hypothetical protein